MLVEIGTQLLQRRVVPRRKEEAKHFFRVRADSFILVPRQHSIITRGFCFLLLSL